MERLRTDSCLSIIPMVYGYIPQKGWKNSIFGAHAMHGTEGVHFYTRLKTVTSRWPTSIRSGAEFKMPTN